MINTKDILETINMVKEENLDIRTVTMGISLLDCASDDPEKTAERVYDKITRSAGRLVPTAEQIEKEYGIPIINKRVSVTPVSLIGGVYSSDDYVEIARALDRAADTLGINFIGGYGALVQKGFTGADRRLIESIPEALSVTGKVCSSVNVASTKAGINMDAVAMMGKIIKKTAYLTRENDCIGCAKFVVFANVPEDNPFMAGAFHGTGEAECVINVGVSGPGVVSSAIERAGDCDFSELAEVIKRTAFKITRMGQLVAREASRRLDVPFGIVDLSLAPTPAVGDSVARILEDMGLDVCGGCGTTAALALLNDAVKKGGVMASSHVGGLSGARKARGDDGCLLRGARYDSGPRRHRGGRHKRADRRRDLHRSRKHKDNGCKSDPGVREESRRQRQLRRTSRTDAGDEDKYGQPRKVHSARRQDPRADTFIEELTAAARTNVPGGFYALGGPHPS